MGKENIEITPSHITGLIAIVVSVYSLITQRSDFPIVAASIYFTLACLVDTFRAKIPNVLNACLLVSGFAINTINLGFQGFLLSLAGLCLGIGLLLFPYLLGGIGAGDVKALGGLGALVGPYSLLQIFIYMGLYGGVLALFHYCYKTNIKDIFREAWFSACASALTRKTKDVAIPKTVSHNTSIRFPYSSAIALGYFSFIYWGNFI